MPVRYEFTPRALEDLYEIWLYIAADKPSAADRVEVAVLAACGRLARFPHLGVVRTDLASKSVRLWPVPRYSDYCVVYLPDIKPLRIIAILQGNRDIASVLVERS